MNAFTPKASVLILLAQMCHHIKSCFKDPPAALNDSEVCEWLARMAELEYIPKPMVTEVVAHLHGTSISGEQVAETLVLKPGDTEVVSKHQYSTLNIGAPTPEMIADAGPPGNYVEQQLAKMIEPRPGPLVGYTLSATHPEEGIICTYREATTLEQAFVFCLEEFPLSEKYSAHSVKNTETGVETPYPDNEIDQLLARGVSSSALMPLLIEENEQAIAAATEKIAHEDPAGTAKGLDLGEEDVVDNGPTALSLDDD